MLLKDLSLIRGLKYFQQFISLQQKSIILQAINKNPWCDRLKRRQQYYGIKYFQTSHQDKILQPFQSLDHFPLLPLQFLIQSTIEKRIFDQSNPPNQILVNKYVKTDRLGLHIEDTNAFGDVIVGISLGSPDFLRLVDVNDRKKEYLFEIKDRSCYILSQDARYLYKHGIGRSISNVKYKTQGFQRISLTIRHVIDTRRKLTQNNLV